MPFLHTYLVDGAGNYVVNNGSRIIVQSYEYGTTGFDWQRIASSTKKPPFIRSFDIKKFDNGATWLLKVNQQMLIGLYPSQDAALQVLRGLFIRCNASQESADVAMSHQLSKGQSTIDQALNNLMLNLVEGNDFNYILSDGDRAGNIGLQTSLNGTTWSAPVLATAYDGVDNPFEFLQVDGYDAVAENSYYRGVFYDGSNNIISFTGTKLKDEADPSGILSVLIQNLEGDGPPEATWDGQTYAGAAYATPQWTVEDWPQGVSPAYTYAWSYQLDNGPLVSVGGSGSTLDLSLVPYGATLKCGAVATAFVNGKIVGSASPAPMVTVAVSEEIPVSFVTDPGASDNSPTAGDSVQPTSFTYGGTEPVTTTYVWRRNGSAISGATSQTYTTVGLDVGKILSCVVTINNAFGPSDNRLVDFGIVQAAGVDLYVADIKLHAGFTGSGNNTTPVGPEITDPQPNTTYYAFAYDQFGSVITGEVTWLEDDAAGVAPSFTGTPTGSHFDPTERTVLSISGTDVAGNPDPTVSYLWSDGSTQATLDTDGMLGDAITCTVTASSVWAPSAEVNIDFGTVQAAAGPVMTQHWTIIDGPPNTTTGTVVQTGLDIANGDQGWFITNGQGWPVIWVGDESANYGAVNNQFANSNDVAPYFNNWEARFRQDGGPWIDFRGSYDAQPGYGTATWYGGNDPGIITPVTGMVYEIEWYNIGDRPV